MKNSKFRFFMDWGLTALAVIASCVLLCFALLKFSVIAAIIKKIITILMPIIRRCTGISDAAGLQQDRSLCPGSSVKGDQK